MTTVIENRPVHSQLGASSAERWTQCSGSVALIKAVGVVESDDPLYRIEGSAMHEAAAHCLENGLDAWEIGDSWTMVGTDKKVEFTLPMGAAVQLYLDCCREDMDTTDEFFIERGISAPVHPLFYGTLDFGAVWRTIRKNVSRVKIRDFKGGEGIVVDVEENPQLMYYAYGLIWDMDLADDTPVELEIVQPRAYDADGLVRNWPTTVGFIRNWVETELVPAMLRTEFDHDLQAGPWCRFCPAKLICPMLTGLFKAAATCDPKKVPDLSEDALGRSWLQIEVVNMYIKALKEETQKRLEAGKKPFGTKLVSKRSDRIFKEDAPVLDTFGAEAQTKPEIKGPAQIELLPGGKTFVSRWAFTPDTGVTVDRADSKKPEIIRKSSTETFAAAIASIPEA